MNKKNIALILIIVIITIVLYVLTIGNIHRLEPDDAYYFFAIHNEAYNMPNGEKNIESDYVTLQEMIRKADEYNIKLTIMFTPQWAEYISKSNERLKELKKWKAKGHEIAAHHHGIMHGNWDGYTNYPKEIVEEKRKSAGAKVEQFNGDLSLFMEKIQMMNADIKSGCMNDELDKNEMPDGIVIDTCSGFSNYGQGWTRTTDHMDATKNKGKNEYIIVGEVNGIERRWLSHTSIFEENSEKEAKNKYESLSKSYPKGVFGTVVHSIEDQAQYFYDFIEFIHEKDPKGERSVTITQVVEDKMLAERKIPDQILTANLSALNSSKLCGDGKCDEVELKNPSLCPSDCANLQTKEVNTAGITIGVVGCSISINAINGYSSLNGTKIWHVTDIRNYGGGSIYAWSTGTGNNMLWPAFEDGIDKYNSTKKIWWELCTAPGVKDMSYYDVVDVLNEIKRIAPGIEIYATPMPIFSDTSNEAFCVAGNSTSIISNYVDRMIKEGLVKKGPVMSPLKKEYTDDQGCHANKDGEKIWGKNLKDFFG